MKLKELLRYLQSNYMNDVAEEKKANEEAKLKTEELENKLKEKEK